MDKVFPVSCPGCKSDLSVESFFCDNCETKVSGRFELPVLLKLNQQDRRFILDFIKCSGSLKIMASKLKLSYPSVRNKLDDLICRIENLENLEKHAKELD